MFTKENPFGVIVGYTLMATTAERVKPEFVGHPLIEQVPTLIAQHTQPTITINLSEYFGMFEGMTVRFYNVSSIKANGNNASPLLPSECGLVKAWNRHWRECECDGWESKELSADQYIALHKDFGKMAQKLNETDEQSLARNPLEKGPFVWDSQLHIPNCPGLKKHFGLVFEAGPRIRAYDRDFAMFLQGMGAKRLKQSPMLLHPEDLNYLTHFMHSIRITLVGPDRSPASSTWPSHVRLDPQWDEYFQRRSNGLICAYGMRPSVFQRMLPLLFKESLQYTFPNKKLIRRYQPDEEVPMDAEATDPNDKELPNDVYKK